MPALLAASEQARADPRLAVEAVGLRLPADCSELADLPADLLAYVEVPRARVGSWTFLRRGRVRGTKLRTGWTPRGRLPVGGRGRRLPRRPARSGSSATSARPGCTPPSGTRRTTASSTSLLAAQPRPRRWGRTTAQVRTHEAGVQAGQKAERRGGESGPPDELATRWPRPAESPPATPSPGQEHRRAPCRRTSTARHRPLVPGDTLPGVGHNVMRCECCGAGSSERPASSRPPDVCSVTAGRVPEAPGPFGGVGPSCAPPDGGCS